MSTVTSSVNANVAERCNFNGHARGLAYLLTCKVYINRRWVNIRTYILHVRRVNYLHGDFSSHTGSLGSLIWVISVRAHFPF